jgi:hypothetical protein
MGYRLAAAALLLAMLGAPASARDGWVRPECRRMGNPRACTCALDNGGRLVPDHHRPGRLNWRSPRIGTGAHMAFMNCAGKPGR